MPKRAKDEAARIHRFLKRKFDSLDFFAKEDLRALVSPYPGFATYWSKKILPLLIEAGRGRYRVSEYFRNLLDLEDFRAHYSQATRVRAEYRKTVRPYLSFRFLLPLANELILRDTLDSLFYSDRILRRLGILERTELERRFPRGSGEGKAAYLERIAKEIGGFFGGYSVHNIQGRFRGESLATYEEASLRSMRAGKKYLFDETTAAIDFLIPIAAGGPRSGPGGPEAEIRRIRWIFMELLVNTILECVNGEAEIWLIETGIENNLHVWKRT